VDLAQHPKTGPGYGLSHRRVGKRPIIEHPLKIFHVSDSNDSGGSGLEDEA